MITGGLYVLADTYAHYNNEGNQRHIDAANIFFLSVFFSCWTVISNESWERKEEKGKKIKKLEASADIMSQVFILPPTTPSPILSLVSATEFNYSHTPI